MEFILIGAIIAFVVIYRLNSKSNIYKYINKKANILYDRFAPYSYKQIRKKVRDLGLDYSSKQYTIQVVIFSILAFAVSYLYLYNLLISVLYVIVAIAFIPYISYLRYKKVYSEFIFEQIQVYTTNTIMEFNTTQNFVKALEGVYASGVLEDPVRSDVKAMINIAYEEGTIDGAIKYMNEKYDYYITRNMHQLFLQITKEGSKNSAEALENMLLDIDMLVESVYRDRIDRQSFHKSFLTYGIMLYFMVMLSQYLLGADTYLQLIDLWYVQIMLHGIILVNSYFLLNGEKYYRIPKRLILISLLKIMNNTLKCLKKMTMNF